MTGRRLGLFVVIALALAPVPAGPAFAESGAAVGDATVQAASSDMGLYAKGSYTDSRSFGFYFVFGLPEGEVEGTGPLNADSADLREPWLYFAARDRGPTGGNSLLCERFTNPTRYEVVPGGSMEWLYPGQIASVSFDVSCDDGSGFQFYRVTMTQYGFNRTVTSLDASTGTWGSQTTGGTIAGRPRGIANTINEICGYDGSEFHCLSPFANNPVGGRGTAAYEMKAMTATEFGSQTVVDAPGTAADTVETAVDGAGDAVKEAAPGAAAQTVHFDARGTLESASCSPDCGRASFAGSGHGGGHADFRGSDGELHDALWTVYGGEVSGALTPDEQDDHSLCSLVGAHGVSSGTGSLTITDGATGITRRSGRHLRMGVVHDVATTLEFDYTLVGATAALIVTGGSVTIHYNYPGLGAFSETVPIRAGAAPAVLRIDPPTPGQDCTTPQSLSYQLTGKATVVAEQD